MRQAIPKEHPAVVLRSRYTQLRALLAITTLGVVGLTTTVVILANDPADVTGAISAKPIESINYGDFNPATGRPESAPLPQREAHGPSAASHYDGGPEEDTRGGRKDYSKNAATGDSGGGAAQESLNGPGARTD